MNTYAWGYRLIVSDKVEFETMERDRAVNMLQWYAAHRPTAPSYISPGLIVSERGAYENQL